VLAASVFPLRGSVEVRYIHAGAPISGSQKATFDRFFGRLSVLYKVQIWLFGHPGSRKQISRRRGFRNL
jgi:hypothetical protein